MIGASQSLILANDNHENLCPDRAKPVPGMPRFLSPFQGSGELELGRDLHPQGVALDWSVRPLRGRRGLLGSPLSRFRFPAAPTVHTDRSAAGAVRSIIHPVGGRIKERRAIFSRS